MSLRVHTAGLVYGGPDRLDVTEPGGPFTPPERLATADAIARAEVARLRDAGHAKSARFLAIETFRAYARQYKEAMLRSWRTAPDAWQVVLDRPRVVLVCACPGETCHRALLAEILVRFGAEDGGELPATDAG